MANEKLNEKYVIYQVLAQNLEALKQQIQIVEQQLIELRSTMLSMEDLEKLKDDNEILVPIGGGCFSRGKISDNRKVIVNVGAGIFLDNDMAIAKKLMDERFREVEKAGMEIEEQMKNIVGQMNTLAAEIQNLAQKAQR